MNGSSAAFLVMGVAVVALTAAVSGFKVTQHVSEVRGIVNCNIILEKRIDRAGATLAIDENSVVYHPEGDIIISSDASESVVFGCQCASERARAISISSDGRNMAIGVPDASHVYIMRRKIQGGAWFEHQVIRRNVPGFGTTVTISPDGKRLFVRGYASWTSFDLVGDMFSIVSESEGIITAAISPCFTYIAAVNDSTLDVVKWGATNHAWRVGDVTGERVSSIAIGPGGEMAVISYAASDVLVYRNGRLIETVKNTVDGFGRTITLTQDKCFIGSPYEDRVYVYSLPTFKYLTSLTPDEGGLNSEFGTQINVIPGGAVAVLAPGYGDDERGAIFIFKDCADGTAVVDPGHS